MNNQKFKSKYGETFAQLITGLGSELNSKLDRAVSDFLGDQSKWMSKPVTAKYQSVLPDIKQTVTALIFHAAYDERLGQMGFKRTQEPAQTREYITAMANFLGTLRQVSELEEADNVL